MESMQHIIWRITDGKKGHDIQSMALTKALQKKVKCKIINLSIRLAWIKIFRDFIGLDKTQKPKIIIGTGHRTHIIILIAKFLIGGKTLLILKPSLPTYFFNLCLIPYHDNSRRIKQSNVIHFHGALNSIEDCKRQNKKKGLILIGGKSRHFEWNNKIIISQIQKITQENLAVEYLLSNSPRTPKDFDIAINKLNLPNLKIFNYKKVNENWILDRLSESGNVWVTNDSVSMIYESLSSGSIVGIIKLSAINNNKIFKSINELIKKNIVRTVAKNINNKEKNNFNEAERCAELVINKLFNTND